MAENNTRNKGTVKWFNGWKGFGFITPDEENSEDFFVHQTSINFEGYRTLHDGQRVEFDVEVGDDGRTRAVNVDVLRSSGNRGGRSNRGGGSSNVECYNCGRFGHLARDCYHDQGGGGRGEGGGRGRGRGSGGGYGRGRGGWVIEGDYDDEGYGRGGGRGRGGHDIEGDYDGEGYGRRGGRGRGGGGRRGGIYRGGRDGGRGGKGGGRGGRGGCYNCGEEGHFARDCSSNNP